MQYGFQIREAHVLAHDEALELMEHRRMGHVVIAPIHAARRDHGKRCAAREHGADLHWRGVRAQQPPIRKIERVV